MSDDTPRLRLLPFRATTYAPETDLARVICPPYDVINADTRRRYERADPRNIVHLTLPRDRAGDTAHGGAPDAERYRLAAAELHRWLADHTLRTDHAPALYVYEHRAAGHRALGLVGGVGLDGPVLAHENTFPGPVADRSALMLATRAQFEPILLTYDGGGPASRIVDDVAAGAPDREVAVGTGETHRVWRIDDTSAQAAIAGDLAARSALIVDGHHRFAAYQQVAAASATEEAGLGLAMLVDARQHPLQLRGVHRSVAGLTPSAAASAAQPWFDTVDLGTHDVAAVLAEQTGTAFVIGDDERRMLLRDPHPELLDRAFPHDRPEGWRRMDAAVMTDVVLSWLWGVDDADERVRYHHEDQDALAAASRAGGVAVIVRPPALTDVLDLARRGVRMPRKSTSFAPKPWTGILMRLLGHPDVAARQPG
ncbi:DUF1015 family protein [Haloactinopolyspora alba]|uniref:DUF1015 family protein n=1 Tax=Haloactinopolyspora alba TaxID=648780 RepID=UPI0013EB1692|nr:DUF1015 domain-containing protein [Haloactinopolyspora alba]